MRTPDQQRYPGLDFLILYGPPEGGKDTLVGNIAEEFKDHVIVPHRLDTRQPHSNEEASEWRHISDEAFEEGVETGVIVPSWQRSLDDLGQRKVNYGFVSTEPDEPRLVILVANNPFFEKPDAPRRLVIAKAMVLKATAHPKILHDRLEEDESTMPEEEKWARHRKIDQPSPQVYRPGEAIDTSDMEPEVGQELFRNLVKDIIYKGWAPRGYKAQPLYLTEANPERSRLRKRITDSVDISRKPLG